MNKVWVSYVDHVDGFTAILSVTDDKSMAMEAAKIHNNGADLDWTDGNLASGINGSYFVKEFSVLSTGPKYQLHNGVQGAR